MVVENEIIIKQRRKNKTAGNFQKFRADAGCICRSKRHQSKDTGKMNLPAEACSKTESEQC